MTDSSVNNPVRYVPRYTFHAVNRYDGKSYSSALLIKLDVRPTLMKFADDIDVPFFDLSS